MWAKRREAKARHVLGFMAGAHAVTEPVELTAAHRQLNARVAVRCSAWLGVRLDSERAWKKSLETMALAEGGQITGDEKMALAERMEASKEQSGRSVETRGMTGDENVAPTGVVTEPRGSDAELAADGEREGSAGQTARNSEQTGRRRGIG